LKGFLNQNKLGNLFSILTNHSKLIHLETIENFIKQSQAVSEKFFSAYRKYLQSAGQGPESGCRLQQFQSGSQKLAHRALESHSWSGSGQKPKPGY